MNYIRIGENAAATVRPEFYIGGEQSCERRCVAITRCGEEGTRDTIGLLRIHVISLAPRLDMFPRAHCELAHGSWLTI
ncbi:hypothetical protein ASF53_16645 [Methylobacterium sp. Leaf123]|nr:hypothetical protein ASF53_16645 [Methylobacterium sp. Leaf123]KQQ15237.1 hypothetical protein ASF59_15590 [Methylobacterium sp. Leaf121]